MVSPLEHFNTGESPTTQQQQQQQQHSHPFYIAMEEHPTDDDLQERLGFKDLQAARDWLIDNPTGRLVRTIDPTCTSDEPCRNAECRSEKEVLKMEIQSVTEKLASLSRTPADTDAQITGETSSTSLGSLNVSYQHHHFVCASMTDKIAKHIREHQQDKKKWLAFKRDYATMVACKIIDDQYNLKKKTLLSTKNEEESGPVSKQDPFGQTGQEDTSVADGHAGEDEGCCKQSDTRETASNKQDKMATPSSSQVRPAVHILEPASAQRPPQPSAARKEGKGESVTPQKRPSEPARPDQGLWPRHEGVAAERRHHPPRDPTALARSSEAKQNSGDAAECQATELCPPTPRWIRYSDRKARHGKMLWNDPPNDLRLPDPPPHLTLGNATKEIAVTVSPSLPQNSTIARMSSKLLN
ncbi:hypothetical protein PCASD_00364 [Puccinia coronata f. sp. avenae]|uniref:Uncharacterized protein n=1 Tax=Puccinia coronata f. sp. avenae TaxID=200324 RepID=A0A2N5VN55_9BASI|nr:hypothetical protein PCASD_00364 [Puccinia coronata f. sp. avenae]